MIDRRRRVGLLIPSSNTVMEPDFWHELPDDVTVHTGRMYMKDATAAAEGHMLDEFTLPVARDVATTSPDVIVFGCTSAGALRGNDYDTELCRRISDISGVPTVSVISAARKALKGYGTRAGNETAGAPRRVGVVTPYVDALNTKIAESLEADGLEVAKISGLGITANVAIADVTPERITQFAAQELSESSIELAFVSCTNFRAVEALSQLERRLGIPVVTSNQAALAAVGEFLRAETSGPPVIGRFDGRCCV